MPGNAWKRTLLLFLLAAVLAFLIVSDDRMTRALLLIPLIVLEFIRDVLLAGDIAEKLKVVEK